MVYEHLFWVDHQAAPLYVRPPFSKLICVSAKPFDNKPSHSMCCHLAIGAGAKNYPYPITCACLRLLKCVLRDHNSNKCTHSGNVCCCTYMVNNDYDKFRSFSRLYMTLFRHRTCTYLLERADRFLVVISNGQVAALSDRAYYQYVHNYAFHFMLNFMHILN